MPIEEILDQTAENTVKCLNKEGVNYQRKGTIVNRYYVCQCRLALSNTSTEVKIPLCKILKGQHSFYYRGVATWNRLSHEIKTAPLLATFKMKL